MDTADSILNVTNPHRYRMFRWGFEYAQWILDSLENRKKQDINHKIDVLLGRG